MITFYCNKTLFKTKNSFLYKMFLFSLLILLSIKFDQNLCFLEYNQCGLFREAQNSSLEFQPKIRLYNGEPVEVNRPWMVDLSKIYNEISILRISILRQISNLR